MATFVGADQNKNLLVSSSVTIRKDAIPLADSLEDLKKQTGNAVADWRPRLSQAQTNPSLKLSFDKTPFWPALDEIARQAHLKVYPLKGESAIGLATLGKSAEVPVAYSGLFRAAIQRMTTTRDFANGFRQTVAAVQLAWEPRYCPLFLKIAADGVQAGGNDKTLQTIPQVGTGALPLLGEQGKEISLQLPANGAIKLLKIRGTAVVAPEMAEFEIKSLAAGATQTAGGVRLTVRDCKSEGNLTTVVVALDYPRDALDLESHQGWVASQNEIALKQGDRRYFSRGRSTSVLEGGPVVVTYQFTDLMGKLDDYVFLYRAPAAPVPCPVEFVFKDLPSP